MPDFSKLVSYKYLFQIDRLYLSPSDWWFLYIGVGLIVLAVLLRVWQRFLKNPYDAKTMNRLFVLTLIAGIIEVIWFGARYQNVMFFGTHFVALLILLILIVWGSVIKIKFLKNRSKLTEAWQKEQLKQKYLNK